MKRCSICSKPIYSQDRTIKIEGVVYHTACFKCTECGVRCSATNYGFYKNKLYCNKHYQALILKKGRDVVESNSRPIEAKEPKGGSLSGKLKSTTKTAGKFLKSINKLSTTSATKKSTGTTKHQRSGTVREAKPSHKKRSMTYATLPRFSKSKASEPKKEPTKWGTSRVKKDTPRASTGTRVGWGAGSQSRKAYTHSRTTSTTTDGGTGSSWKRPFASRSAAGNAGSHAGTSSSTKTGSSTTGAAYKVKVREPKKVWGTKQEEPKESSIDKAGWRSGSGTGGYKSGATGSSGYKSTTSTYKSGATGSSGYKSTTSTYKSTTSSYKSGASGYKSTTSSYKSTTGTTSAYKKATGTAATYRSTARTTSTYKSATTQSRDASSAGTGYKDKAIQMLSSGDEESKPKKSTEVKVRKRDTVKIKSIYCKVCKNQIFGISCTVKDEFYHVACFKCSKCSKLLVGGDVKVVNGKLYCPDC